MAIDINRLTNELGIDLNNRNPEARLQQVTEEKNNALNNINNQYSNMINNSDAFYNQQIQLSKDYADKQSQIQQEQTDFTIEKINQQKEKAEQNYLKEQKGAYADYQEQSNDYGINAERMASQGLNNSGVSETSKVSMYNAYQNRYALARQSYNDAVLNYDNGIKDAQLQNNSALAEISLNALKEQLELGLQGFQYKNSLLQQQLQQQRDIESLYQSRWDSVLSQINAENNLINNLRQFNEEMALKREQVRQEQSNWEREFAYQKQKDSQDTDLLGLLTDGTPTNNQYGYFSNGYQPKGIDGYGAVSQTGSNILVTNSKTGKSSAQNVWKTDDGTKWYWDGNKKKYIKLTGTKTKVTI